MNQFDPYYNWLGIPLSEQPPNHYQLLGVQVFEANPSVLDNAADRQMRHLRSFQNGPNAADSQRLLNEVAAARICLLDASRKAAYDREMRQPETLKPPSVIAPIAPNTSGSTAGLLARNTASARTRQTSPRNSIIEIAKIVIGGISGIAVAVLVMQYATGVDLAGWSAKARQENEDGSKPSAKSVVPKTTDRKPATNLIKTPTPSQPTPSQPTPSPRNTQPVVQPPLTTPREAISTAPIADDEEFPNNYVFRGPALPENVSIKNIHNTVHADGLVTLDDVDVPQVGAWAFKNQELVLTSVELANNTAVEILSLADEIQEIHIRARTIPPKHSSVRIVCGNVYVILNWEVENENHLLIDGRRVAVSSPHGLTEDKVHNIVLRKSSQHVSVIVDSKEVISAKGGTLTGNVQVASSHLGSIAIESVRIISKPFTSTPAKGIETTIPLRNPSPSLEPPAKPEPSTDLKVKSEPALSRGLGTIRGDDKIESDAGLGEKTGSTEAELTVLIATLNKSGNPQQRAAAAERIGRFGKGAAVAVPQLTKSLKDVNETVRARCIFALGTIGPEARDAISDLAKQMETEVVDANRGNILRAMMLIDPKSDELQKLLTGFLIGGPWSQPRLSDDVQVIENRTFACEIIALIGPDAQWASPHLREIMNRYAPHLDSEPMSLLFCSSVKALGRIGKKDSATLMALNKYREGKGLRMRNPSAEMLKRAIEACDTALRELESSEDKKGK